MDKSAGITVFLDVILREPWEKSTFQFHGMVWVADTKYLDPSAQICWDWLLLNFKLAQIISADL